MSDLYDKASIIFNDRDKFVKYLLSQKNQRILVLSAAYRGVRSLFKYIKEQNPNLGYSESLPAGFATIDGDDLNITFRTLDANLRGLRVNQLVLVFPFNMSRKALDIVMNDNFDSDVILFTGEI